MIYELTLEGEYAGQQIINRWNYLSSGAAVGITGAAALLNAAGFIDTAGNMPADTLGRAIQLLLSEEYSFIQVIAKAIREAPTDFYDYGYPAGTTAAAGSTEGMSPVVSYGFRTNLVRTDIARATKRFVGVVEGNVGPLGELTSTAKTTVQDIADLMSETLSYTDGGSSLTFAPVVVSKEKYHPVGKTTWAYKYYDTIAEQLEHIGEGIVWSPYNFVRSQTSRQVGHGR